MADPIIKALDDWLVAAGGSTTNLAASEAELWRQIDDQIVGSAPASASIWTHCSRIYNNLTAGSIATGLPFTYMLQQMDLDQGGAGVGSIRTMLESIAANYSATNLLDSIIAFWKLEEASGSRTDEVGTNTLTDNNTTPNNTGVVGNAADFNRINNEYLSIADNTDLSFGDEDFSISCWAYQGGNRTTLMGIVTKWEGTDFNYRLAYNNNLNRFIFSVSHDGTTVTTVTADDAGNVLDNTWYHLVCWHDAIANEIGIAVNASATPDTASHTTGIHDGPNEFRIGQADGTSQDWHGRIDAVGVWGRVLTSDERTELYNSGSGKEHPFT